MGKIVGAGKDLVEGRGKGNVRVVSVLFVLVLVSNVVGMIPYSYTVTAQLVVTM